MSVSERTIKAFIQIIETQSILFSIEDWADLHELASNLPEDTEEISTIIRSWLKLEQRNQLQEAFEIQRKNIPSSFSFSNQQLGIANSKSPTPANQLSESSKELIENAIKRNSPLSDNTKSNQKS
ncbi:MAG: hypothetical protein RMY28_025725 [Nostoc sp. ChiSLP01]|nr:hypothetical protein [Nostoc sp. CmiSLP01]MDZ8282291.1 hypothetical protein [Nostoc sp. ChiSLP01]